MDEVAQAVRVDADLHAAHAAQVPADGEQGVERAHRLAVPAEDDLLIGGEVVIPKGREDLFGGGVVVEPEAFGRAEPLLLGTDAEGAAAGAFVGQVDVEAVAVYIKDIFHHSFPL